MQKKKNPYVKVAYLGWHGLITLLFFNDRYIWCHFSLHFIFQ